MWIVLSIRKYLKTLLGDVAAGAVALGLALGILGGLPPAGLFTALVIVALLVFRANLTTFLLGFALAKAVGLAAAPALDALGRRLLDASSLKGLWTFLLNLPVISLCGLDRYLVFGATVVALLLALPVFLLTWLLLPPLRRAFWARVARSERINRYAQKGIGKGVVRILFGRKTVEPAEAGKRAGIFRKGFLLPTGAAVLVLVVLLQVFGDGLARRAIELVSSQVLRRDVTLGSANLGFFGGSLGLGEMRLRRPKALAEASDEARGQRFTLDLSPLALLDRRLVVDELTAENLVYHPQAEDAPTLPPEPAPGQKVGLGEVLAWVEAHRSQVEWVLGRLDGFLRGGDAAPDPKAPGFLGRAAYVYGNRPHPTVLIRKAGVKNLGFEWEDSSAPLLAGLERLDLMLSDLSSNPVRHTEPVVLEGVGRFRGANLTLKGVLDARAGANAGHRIDLAFELAAFGRQGRLGLAGGRDLKLEIGAAFDPATRRLREARCTGSFLPEAAARVAFAFTTGEKTGLELDVTGLDFSRLTDVRRPEAFRVDKGLLDLKARFGVVQGRLDGALGLSARDLLLAPGQAKKLAGVSAADFCAALNALTKTRPLVVSLGLGGTPDSPTVHLEDGAMKELLEQLKAGLVAVGRNAVAAELDRRVGELAGKLGGKVPAGLDPGDAARRLQEEAAKRAKGALEGLLGGKKKEPDREQR